MIYSLTYNSSSKINSSVSISFKNIKSDGNLNHQNETMSITSASAISKTEIKSNN